MALCCLKTSCGVLANGRCISQLLVNFIARGERVITPCDLPNFPVDAKGWGRGAMLAKDSASS